MNNDIKINFSTNIKDFSKYIQDAQKSLEGLNVSLTGISHNTASTTFRSITEEGNKTIKMSQRFNNKSNQLTGWTISVKEADQEAKTFFGTISNLSTKMVTLGATAAASMKKAYNSMLKFTTYSVNQSEALNLFNVVFKNIEKDGTTTFSELGKQADKFQQKLKNNFGVNAEESLTFQALYQSMASSMGISDEVAYILSENTTEMVYDLSSLFNKSQEDTAEALRAGIYAGQTKPLRSFGIDITETSLQATLDELAKTNSELEDMSVSTMSQAEKQILRYITAVRQASAAQEDYANTLESPANQLKILQNQLQMTGAAIGNLLIGPFQKFLQMANAVIIVIRYLAEALANLFGIKQSDYNTGGLKPLADDADDVSDSLGKASKKADELKKKTLGFDQINNINTDDDKNKNSGLGGINQSLIDSIADWKSGLDDARLKAEQIANKIMEWLGFTYDEIDGVWKLKDGFQNVYWVVGIIGTILGGIVLGSLVKIITKIGNIIGAVSKLKNIKTLFETGKILKYVKALGGVTLAIAGVVNIFKGLSKIMGTEVESGMYQVVGGIGLIATALMVVSGLWVPALAIGAVSAIALTMSSLTKLNTNIMTTKQAEENLRKATEDLTNAHKNYANAIDEAENSQKRLDDLEKQTKISGEELYNSVQNGTLDYANMTSTQREVYKAYIDNLAAEQQLEDMTDALNDAKKNQTKAELENSLAIAKESGDYQSFKNSVVDAFNQGKISSEEARDYIERACGGMSDDFKSTFTEDLPEDINSGLDTNRYDSKWTKFKRWFGSKMEEIGENVKKLFTVTIPNKISEATTKMKNAIVGLAKKCWNVFAEWINSKSTIRIGNTLKTILNGLGIDVEGSYQVLHVPTFATGGFPEEGPFMMNKGEIAGKFSNGKSVVANNEQITEGIKRAVLSGMNEAMANNQSNVKLDIRTEEGIIVKKAINGINQITRATGESPLAW